MGHGAESWRCRLPDDGYLSAYRPIQVQFDFLCDHDADKLAFEDEILAMGGRVFRVMVSQRVIRDKVPYHIDVVFPRPS